MHTLAQQLVDQAIDAERADASGWAFITTVSMLRALLPVSPADAALLRELHDRFCTSRIDAAGQVAALQALPAHFAG